MMQWAASMGLLHPAYTIFRSDYPVGVLWEVAANVVVTALQVLLPADAAPRPSTPNHYSATRGAR